MERGSPQWTAANTPPPHPPFTFFGCQCAVFFIASPSSLVALHWLLTLLQGGGGTEDSICDALVRATKGT